MTHQRSIGFALRRTISSLAAIAAISAIFGAKALESEHQAAAAITRITVADSKIPESRAQ